jgi:HEPN domain-containing protein
MFDNDEFERWMAQASDTLNSARQDYSNKSYNWCCFKAQQAAEYSVKALLKGVGISAYGHSLVKLLKDLETYTLNIHTLTSCARILDRHYVPARYLMPSPRAVLLNFMMRKPRKRLSIVQRRFVIFALR